MSVAAGPEALPVLGTHFGGTPYAEPPEIWPSCSGCRSDLTFIGQFDFARSPNVPLRPVGLLTFFYCWACTPSGLKDDPPGSWAARLHSSPDASKAISIGPRTPPEHQTRPCWVLEERVSSHPDWDEVELRHPDILEVARQVNPESPSDAYQAAVKEIVGDYRMTTQAGGFARWIQWASREKCRTCDQPLELLLQIDSIGEADCDFGLSGLAYLLTCPTHPSAVALVVQYT